MSRRLREALERHIEKTTGEPARIIALHPVGGGCIHDTAIAELADGRRLFVKSSSRAPADLFEREAEGLSALVACGALRVPRDASPGGDASTRFLVMEAIESDRPRDGFFALFGRRLARLHRAGRARRFGFSHDNYLGASRQPNPWTEDGCAFWRDHRLGFQLELARCNGVSEPLLDRLGERLLARLDRWLEVPGEPPCLIHGDLWSGNYLVDERGDPVLIDPAVYHGHREAELAMCRLFGGFDDSFFAAYSEEWPLAPGSAERLPLFKLYHVLNHLNLFGGAYRSQALAILRRYAG